MNVRLAYGTGMIDVLLPPGVTADVIESKETDPLSDPSSAIAAALANPIESAPLGELAAGKKTAVFSVPDATRPIPLPAILPALLEAITPSIPKEKVLVLFATGMHRPVTEEEARCLLGETLASELRWESHDPARTRNLGVTDRGAAIDVDERFLDADLRIAVGLVEPHLLAGFSGGRKLVGPGLVSMETMRVLHGPGIVGHEKARAGVLDGNPMHSEALAIARASGLHFTVNVTIGKGRRLSGVFAGEPDLSHRAACEAVTRTGRTDRGGRDLVITSGGGAPLDATFYQSVKGIVGAEALVKPGGAILLCASCDEGWGSESFLSLLTEAPDLDSFLAWASKEGNFRRDQWMVQHLREAMRGKRIYVYSEHLHRSTASILGLTPVDSPAAGIDAAIHGSANPSVAVIPNGPYTWVRVE
ncbi:MAG: nickel-dependent lactate racemase [Candidatus Eisenbacteria bacterium]